MSVADQFIADRIAKQRQRQRLRGRIERKQRAVRRLREEIDKLEAELAETLGVPRVFTWRGKRRLAERRSSGAATDGHCGSELQLDGEALEGRKEV